MGWKIRGSNPTGTGDFSLLQNIETGSGPHDTSYARYRGSFPGIKRRVLQVHHSHRPSAEVKNTWSCTYTSPIRLNSVDRDRFTSTYFGITSVFLVIKVHSFCAI